MARGWDLDFSKAEVDRLASITIDYKGKRASVHLDRGIFDNPDVPEGCKVFMLFHEAGHLHFGPAEELCDEFAFYNALRVGVSPFLCYVAIRTYMPEHYDYRVERLGKILLSLPHLKNDIE